MTMTVCDLAAITKPWPIEKRVSFVNVRWCLRLRYKFFFISWSNFTLFWQVAELVTREFFEQGDIERNKFNITPIVSWILFSFFYLINFCSIFLPFFEQRENWKTQSTRFWPLYFPHYVFVIFPKFHLVFTHFYVNFYFKIAFDLFYAFILNLFWHEAQKAGIS